MERILRLLSRLDVSDLRAILGHQLLRGLEATFEVAGSRVDLLDPDELGRMIAAIYGTQLLSEKRIRRKMLELVDDLHLQELAAKHCKKNFSKSSDNALTLARLPWKGGSTLVRDVLSGLGLGHEFGPKRFDPLPSVESVYPLSPPPELHSYQRSIVDRICLAFEEGKRSLLVQMPTGTGKTRTALEALFSFCQGMPGFGVDRSVLWLCHSEELVDQAYEAVKRLWPHRGGIPLRVVRLSGVAGKSRPDCAGAFVCMTFQQLYASYRTMGALLSELVDTVSVCVVDEAHRLLAKTFSACVRSVCERSGCTLLGLTATPGRGLELFRENVQLASLFGKGIIGVDLGSDPISELRDQGILSQLRRVTIESHVLLSGEAVADSDDAAGGCGLSGGLLRELGRNVKRNALIIESVKREVLGGDPAIVFACSVEHAELLAAAWVCSGISASVIHSELSPATRRELVLSFVRGDLDILVNFGVLTTGFDAPRVKVVVITRPTTSVVLYSQMIGRGLRGPRMGGTAECKLVDVVDNFQAFGGVGDVYGIFEGYWQGG